MKQQSEEPEAPERVSQQRVNQPEPWLRGTHTEISAVARAVVHALELAAEDAARWTSGLTEEELHPSVMGVPSVAWQMQHIVRSVDRLLSYAEGRPLSAAQMEALRREGEPVPADALQAEFRTGLQDGMRRVLALASVDLETPRGVGRKNLPTTVGGLLVHVADHTQRHVGQLVTTAKLVLELRNAAR